MQYRQGDVLIEEVAALKCTNVVPRDAGRIILAYGEVTGHAHAIMEPDALLYDDNEGLYLKADGTVTLRHEEHGPVTIPQGFYRVTRQREYSPEAIRNVVD